MSYAEVNNMLNKQSGVFGVSGVSSDMRDIDKAYEEGNPRAILARDMYCLRIKKFVGEYAAEMGGVDLIVFTGGVGENSPETRKEVCEGLEFMGVHFDRKINEGLRGENKIIPQRIRRSRWPSFRPTRSWSSPPTLTKSSINNQTIILKHTTHATFE